ncbi:MAG: diacylglycerol kinase family protein [Ruminococcus sp.]|nr:diacylglycerol kinase family protein [Ruminococcus sp.]
MKNQIFGFKCAFKGVWDTLKSESHMRFHMVAAFYVIVFSSFYSFSNIQWAILVLTICLVMVLEMINTCIEKLCNLVADRYEPLVKIAKDISAGAVLISAIGSAIVAVLFFLDFNVIVNIISFFAENPFYLILLIISAVLSVIFVCLGPVGIKTKFFKIKNR